MVVKSQRRLSGTAEAGNDDKLVSGNINVDMF